MARKKVKKLKPRVLWNRKPQTKIKQSAKIYKRVKSIKVEELSDK